MRVWCAPCARRNRKEGLLGMQACESSYVSISGPGGRATQLAIEIPFQFDTTCVAVHGSKG